MAAKPLCSRCFPPEGNPPSDDHDYGKYPYDFDDKKWLDETQKELCDLIKGMTMEELRVVASLSTKYVSPDEYKFKECFSVFTAYEMCYDPIILFRRLIYECRRQEHIRQLFLKTHYYARIVLMLKALLDVYGPDPLIENEYSIEHFALSSRICALSSMTHNYNNHSSYYGRLFSLKEEVKLLRDKSEQLVTEGDVNEIARLKRKDQLLFEQQSRQAEIRARIITDRICQELNRNKERKESRERQRAGEQRNHSTYHNALVDAFLGEGLPWNHDF